MAGMSQVTALGNIGRDAQLRQTNDGSSVCSFSLAANVRKGRKEEAVWYDCTLWGKRAESLAQYLTKGTTVLVTGQLVPRSYKSKSDELRTSLDVDVRELAFAGKPEAKSESTAPPAGGDDEDIPF